MPITNSEPFNVLAGPIEVYRAPVATAFPLLNASPAGTWKLIGTNGSKDYHESGLTIRHPNDISEWHSLGRAGTSKTFRNSEGMEVEFIAVDMTEEAYAMALNKDTADIVTTAAATGIPGFKTLPLMRGFVIPTFALLLRFGGSPYGNNLISQWEIPMAQDVGEPELVFTKNEPVGLQYLFKVLEDPANGFGNVRMQHTAALP